ncbi:hypothetical protein FORC81_p493 (plasmid) [Escherichia coli]|nr:hypothetical protein FORC81_p493 [Escherichia coli]
MNVGILLAGYRSFPLFSFIAVAEHLNFGMRPRHLVSASRASARV